MEPHSEILEYLSPFLLGLLLVIGAGLILLTIYYSKLYFGEDLYLSALILLLTGTDAISMSVSKQADNLERNNMATLMIVIAALSSRLIKMGIGIFKSTHHLSRLLIYHSGRVVISRMLCLTISNFK